MPLSPTTSSPPDPAPATTSHDINKTLIVVGVVVLEGLLVWKIFVLEEPFHQKGNHTGINSQVCLARKEMTCPAALKVKLTIEPMRPGRIETIFLPIVCSPFPMPLPNLFRALVNAPITTPIVTSAARTMAVTVNPYFWKIYFTPSRSGAFPEASRFVL